MNHAIALVCAASLACFSLPARAVDAERLPNIVFILADDLGWSDTTLYGGTKFYETPNIERLAARGMTFTRAYAASPLCSPTRAAILTGLSPARTGLTTPNCHLPEVVLEARPGASAPPGDKAIPPKPVTRLKVDYRTLPEALKEVGYATGHFGKWHLGAEPYSPLEHGFDVDLPHHSGPGPAGSYVAPWKFKDFDHDPDVPHQHIEDRMAEEAVAWMEQQKGTPFFLNYWMFSVHAPFNAKQGLVEKYRERVDPDDPQRSPTYAAMIESMDDAVGTLLNALDRLEIADETLVIFTSDNGGNMYNEIDGTTPTSNVPLRGGKATMFEGGTRVPCVVAWPGLVEAGTRNDTAIQSEDFFPTILAALGIKPAPDQHFDGSSFLPALKGEELSREPLFQYFPHAPGVPDWLPPSVSVHHGDWKLIRIFHGGEDGKHQHLLYDLTEDLGERNDLSQACPEIVQELDGLIEAFLVETQAVRPVPNPRFEIAKYRPDEIGKQKVKKKPDPQPAANADADPRLQGWKARNCKASVKDGIVTIVGRNNAFLGLGTGQLGMKPRVRFRLRCGGGDGKVEWLPNPRDVNEVRTQPYSVKAGDWLEVAASIPAEAGQSGILRLYLPTGNEPVEIDWIELMTEEKTRRWDF